MSSEEKNFNFELEPGQFKKDQLSINDGKPLISIITAYYNSKEFIRQTANSVFNQTFPYWEWIIVDDGSTEEGTSEILEALAKEDSRIKIFHKKNEGPAGTRMFAVKKATTDLLFILDSDDLIDKTFLECGYFTLLANKEAAWAYSSMVNFAEQEYLWSKYFSTAIEKRENVVCGNSIIRKQAFLEVGGYGESKKNIHEDWQLWLKLMAKGYFPVRMNFYGFWYRRRKGSVLHTINSDKKKDKMATDAIKLLAKEVKKDVKAVQFPRTDTYSYNSYPIIWNFDRKPVNIKGEKKRLLFILPWFTVGGADKFNCDLITKLDPEKYDVTIVTTEIAEYIWRQKVEPYADVFDLNTFLDRKDWASFIYYLMKSRNIDLVFISNSLYGYYVMPWLKSQFPKVPFVDYLHAEDFSWRDGAFPRDSVSVSRLLDMTYTCTKHLEDVMFERMNRKIKNTKPVYIGVDEKHFDPKKDYSEKALDVEKYKGKNIVLYPCRIVELKRPIFMLRVLEQICKKRKDIIFFVVGDGPELGKTKEMAEKLNLKDNIVFFGMKKDLRAFYKVSKVSLVCSLTEGLTLTAYESLAMGVPVVSSDVGGQKELITDECGKIIKTYQTVEKDLYNHNYSSEEINAYVKAITDIIDNKNYQQMSENCRNSVEKNYTVDKMVKTMSKEFDRLIEKGSTVNEALATNTELSVNYLIMYNELNKRYIVDDNDLSTLKRKVKYGYRRTKDFLWKQGAWRTFIKLCQKTGIVKMKKALFNRSK